eukprot:snap_masked-scaffold_30-processed-gene-2.57-mRNA-1 protein AED:1.00 eAED:1.00 QI:0/0/0/0/1/1/2/0/70
MCSPRTKIGTYYDYIPHTCCHFLSLQKVAKLFHRKKRSLKYLFAFPTGVDNRAEIVAKSYKTHKQFLFPK